MDNIEPGIYNVPKGYRAILEEHGTVLKIVPRINKLLEPDEYRCIHCIHRMWGYQAMCTRYGEPKIGWVCNRRPKDPPRRFYNWCKSLGKNPSDFKTYYTVCDYNKPCNDFEVNPFYQRFKPQLSENFSKRKIGQIAGEGIVK